MPEVLDISSDEEQSCSEEGLKSSDYDWIREFLGMSGDEQESEDSDEVVIIHENKPQSKSKSLTVAAKDVDDDGDDGDCVVLDGDPESGVTSVDDESLGGSDELLVVGEKGQIACRDYPHARHLCAKFPFSSTPHESHCDQCHCYVCDSLAPCRMWGTGLLSSDHCHADDKIEIWKIQRKNFKVGNTSPLPASTKHGTSLLAGNRQCNEILPLDVTHLPPDSLVRNQASRSTAMHAFSSLNSMPQNQASWPTRLIALSPSLNPGVQNQVPRPNNIPVYSAATNLTTPNGANHGRCQQSGGSTLVRNRYQPHSIQKQWLGVRKHTIHRDRGSGASSLGPQVLRSHTMPNRVANAVTVNYSGHVSSGFGNHANPVQQQQCDKYHTATGFSSDRNRNEPNRVWLPRNLPLYPNPSSETEAYSQPLPQSNDGHNFYQSSIQGNDAPSGYVATISINNIQLGNGHQIGNQNDNASGNIAQCGIASQETYQPKPQEESPRETSRNANITAFGSGWTENTGHSIEPLVSCSHGSGSTNQPPNGNESSNHVTATGSVEAPTESSHMLSSLDIENWLFDKDLIPRVSDNGALPSELSNIPSPDFGLDGMVLTEYW